MSFDKHASSCPSCSNETKAGLLSWHRVCPVCGYEAGDFEPMINDEAAHFSIDEEDREAGLREIRVQNFKEILDLIQQNEARNSGRLLDVGCAHGWFLEEAASRYSVLGVEPDSQVFMRTAAKGLPVRKGYFPEALEPDEQFHAIVFNDVFEHIPDVHAITAVCHQRLVPGGLLVLNLPNSKGFFYRLSKLFARLGWAGPFERLWQKGFPSPHVHYFNSANLTDLVSRHGFALVKRAELPSIRAKGMLSRMRFDKSASSWSVWVQYLGIMAVLPLTRLFPSDVLVCLYRRE
ncbi:methyltransferase [Cupriavidus sp. IDO]|nr:methyltransferase [Cupriavidus sp. IDO]